MPKKRAGRRTRPAFRLVQGKLYRLTPARGKAARAEARKRRKKAKAAKGRVKRAPPVVGPAVPAEIQVFGLDPSEQGHSGFEPIDEMTPGTIPRQWRAHLKLTREGVTVYEERDFLFPAVEWYYTGAALIRHFTLWRDTVKALHPDLFSESPAIGLVALALVP